MATSASNRKLAKKIRQHYVFLTSAVKFTLNRIKTNGKVVSRNEHSSHTHVLEELIVGHFRLVSERGMTVMGGEAVRIFHKDRLVFDVSWQTSDFDPKTCMLRVFENEAGWTRSLRSLIRNPKTVDKLISREKKGEEKPYTIRLQERIDDKASELTAEARRLLLIT